MFVKKPLWTKLNFCRLNNNNNNNNNNNKEEE
jgi:hypothetical protein